MWCGQVSLSFSPPAVVPELALLSKVFPTPSPHPSTLSRQLLVVSSTSQTGSACQVKFSRFVRASCCWTGSGRSPSLKGTLSGKIWIYQVHLDKYRNQEMCTACRWSWLLRRLTGGPGWSWSRGSLERNISPSSPSWWKL